MLNDQINSDSNPSEAAGSPILAPQRFAIENANQALERATSGNILELCRKYLALLTDYRDELYKFRGTPEINFDESSTLTSSEVQRIRKEIRAAVTHVTAERNRVQTLVDDFTQISGYEAVQTFNRQKYKGSDNWEIKAGGLRFEGATDFERITIYDAVEIAGRLRREEYLTLNRFNLSEPCRPSPASVNNPISRADA